MKIITLVSLTTLLTLFTSRTEGQAMTIVKLKSELDTVKSDSSRFRILDSLSIYYLFCSDKTDSSYFYANESIKRAFPLTDKRPLILAYARMGSYFYYAAKYGAALQILNKGITLSEQANFYNYSSFSYITLAEIYTFLDQYNKAQPFLEKARFYLKFDSDPFYNIQAQTYIAYSLNYLFSGKMDSASYSLDKVNESLHSHADLVSEDQYLEAMVMLKTGLKQYVDAIQSCLKALNAVRKNDDHQTLDFIYYEYAILLEKNNEFSEAITEAKLSLKAARDINDIFFIVKISKLISDCYDSLGKRDSTLFYLKLNADYYAQLDNARNISDVEAAEFSDQLHAQEARAQNSLAEEKDKNRLRLLGFLLGLTILVSISIVMWRNNVNRKKAFAILAGQKEETEIQKSKAELALKELKSTQTQLIQSEKMASLGELTAGIAHEIQNPLNFVNNFSEVNREMIAEMKDEIDKGNFDEVKIIANDIEANEEKINHHGKRADAIVKGMLQHSRTNTGQKEPTDINTLCDEYLRLSYHGMRAKDKNFNADFKTDFDETIGKINIIPQDIGRVLLNLFNNAFYAVNEKKKNSDERYQPTVSVQTKKINDKIEIVVNDNGNGIPQKDLDKIFQPFFTTKPTGEGTGLGLSLSYDIIKAHGGEIKVEAKDGEGSVFIIELLLTKTS